MTVQSVYSKLDEDHLLARVVNAFDCNERRVDVTPPEQFLQACVLPLELGKEIGAHIHAPRAPSADSNAAITQEGWIVLRGKIRVRLYDMDKTFLQEIELVAGNLIITFYGGHSMTSMDEDTLIVEFKNGPYKGRDFTYFSGGQS